MKRLNEQAVRAVPEPEFTRSWHPMSHGKVIDALELAVNKTGMEIANKTYSMNGSGMNMFGTWTLDHETNGFRWMIGLRNSMCKSFAIGIAAGDYVTVCSNMMFSGEFIEFRRHTSGVDLEELRLLSERAVKGVFKKLEDLTMWHDNLKGYSLTDGEFKLLTFDAMKSGAVAPAKFRRFLECHEEELAISDQSLYTFHGAGTRLIKDNSLFNISDYSRHLTGVCDDYMIRLAA